MWRRAQTQLFAHSCRLVYWKTAKIRTNDDVDEADREKKAPKIKRDRRAAGGEDAVRDRLREISCLLIALYQLSFSR